MLALVVGGKLPVSGYACRQRFRNYLISLQYIREIKYDQQRQNFINYLNWIRQRAHRSGIRLRKEVTHLSVLNTNVKRTMMDTLICLDRDCARQVRTSVAALQRRTHWQP